MVLSSDAGSKESPTSRCSCQTSDVIASFGAFYADHRKMPLREHLFYPELGTRSIGDSCACLHLLVLHQAWWCMDIVSDCLAQDQRHVRFTCIEVRVRHTDC